MRVLASADLHGKRPVYEWLVSTAREQRVEAVVLAGDLFGCLDGFATPELAQEHEARFTVMPDLDVPAHFNVASAGRERAMILDLESLEHQIVRGPSMP